MSTIDGIQEWFASTCDEDWEHQYGVTIQTLDNPGWLLDIDLHGTSLHDKHFEPREVVRSEQDWLHCSVTGGVFHGRCGPRNLKEALEVFLNWASGA